MTLPSTILKRQEQKDRQEKALTAKLAPGGDSNPEKVEILSELGHPLTVFFNRAWQSLFENSFERLRHCLLRL